MPRVKPSKVFLPRIQVLGRLRAHPHAGNIVQQSSRILITTPWPVWYVVGLWFCRGIVTVRPGGRTAPKPAVQWTVCRRYGGAGSLTTPDGTGRWTGRPSTVDGRGGKFYDAMEYSRSSINLIFPEGSRIEIAVNGLMRPRSRLRLSASGTQLEGNECGNQVGDSPFILCIFTAKAARYVDVVMNLAAKRQTPKTVLIHQHISPSGVPRGPASRNEGWEAGPDGHGTVAASSLPTSGDVAERCSRPSIRPRVDGTPVLTTVRRRDGGLRRPIAQRRDGTVVRPSVRPTVLDGTNYFGLAKTVDENIETGLGKITCWLRHCRQCLSVSVWERSESKGWTSTHDGEEPSRSRRFELAASGRAFSALVTITITESRKNLFGQGEDRDTVTILVVIPTAYNRSQHSPNCCAHVVCIHNCWNLLGTADERICLSVPKVFNSVTGTSIPAVPRAQAVQSSVPMAPVPVQAGLQTSNRHVFGFKSSGPALQDLKLFRVQLKSSSRGLKSSSQQVCDLKAATWSPVPCLA
ncbi:hypothetical protein DFH08DRAFT_828391 [Mycena albidolilacea]|uniref:Uncharacterized protein n=1 Tax=Mycena albidolilacea TaxID=1033008 RepID=A0AAD6YWF2_9AGAR|nr:hypothetical protein DFH08DRAFT_828391 [Mycena albidolilacea]